MPQTLWAPWRMDYLLNEEQPSGCILCNVLQDGEEQWDRNLILALRSHSYVIMNRYPYAHGHIMIVPRRHVANLADLNGDERTDLLNLVVDAQIALEGAFKPQGMNIGMNLGKCGGAGIADHLHVHIVPRWEGDTNFMPMLADTRVMPEHLSETHARLKSTFEALSEHRPQ